MFDESRWPFELAAILERADPFDAFVSERYTDIDALPAGAKVGTSSLRRQSQLRARRPDLQLVDLRGNVNTRLAKLAAGEYDAIILACAGLERLGLSSHIRHRLEAPGWLPAVAQGAIAIECREGDAQTSALLSVLDHATTRTCVEAERAMNRRLHGSCTVPIAAYATLDGKILSLEGLVGSAETGVCIRASEVGRASDPEGLGRLVAAELMVKARASCWASTAESAHPVLSGCGTTRSRLESNSGVRHALAQWRKSDQGGCMKASKRKAVAGLLAALWVAPLFAQSSAAPLDRTVLPIPSRPDPSTPKSMRAT